MALTYSKLSDTEYKQIRYDAISYMEQSGGKRKDIGDAPHICRFAF